jgi:ATP-binding cassette subfamily C protein CydC
MRGVLWRLVRLILPYWRRIILATALGAATIASSIGLLTTSAYIISKAALRPSIAELQVAIVGVRFFGISRAGFRYLERLVSHDVNLRLLARLRVWLYEAIEPLAPGRLIHAHSGDLLARIATDVETLENLFIRVVAPLLVAATIGGVVTVLVGALAPSAAFVLLGTMFAAGVALPLASRYLGRTPGRLVIATRAELNQALVDAIQGSADLLAFGSAATQQARIQDLGRRLARLQERMGSDGALVAAISGLLLNVTVLGLLLVAVPLVRTARLDGVMLGVLIMAAISSFEALLPLPLAMHYLDHSLAAGQRIFEIIDARPLVSDPPHPSVMTASPTVEINRLTFSYEGDQAPALEDVTFTIPASGRVALTGPSGAGKSTLVNLLLRFWDYHIGSIKIGGVELRELSQEDVRRAISVVSQSTYLFNATVRENLLLARPQASEQELIEAARRAQIHHVICSFPDGYDTWIGERGLQLSGGERQRLAVARAILKDAPILVLDEPTANLDSTAESEIMKQLQNLMQSRTTLLVTHRLFGLRTMDQILVLQNGRLTERGTHQELVSTDGLYARMWRRQCEAFP